MTIGEIVSELIKAHLREFVARCVGPLEEALYARIRGLEASVEELSSDLAVAEDLLSRVAEDVEEMQQCPDEWR